MWQSEVPLLLVPDVLVCSVGTEIFFESTGEADEGWARVLDQGWDRASAIAAAEGIPELAPQVNAGLRAGLNLAPLFNRIFHGGFDAGCQHRARVGALHRVTLLVADASC